MYRVYGTYLRIAGQSESEYDPEHHHGQGEKLGQLVRVNRHDVHIPRQWNHVLLNKLFDLTFLTINQLIYSMLRKRIIIPIPWLVISDVFWLLICQ